MEAEGEVDTEDDLIFIPAYPKEGQIVNPSMPYVGEIPEPLYAGRMIAIDAMVLPKANRFSVDLVCGANEYADVALHFNPRLDQKCVVRNCRVSGRWGEEETAVPQRNPFLRGQSFYLYIFISNDEFMIAMNGRHFCAFTYRVPVHRVFTVQIHGDLKLFQLEHRLVEEYPLPGPGSTDITIPVPTRSCPSNLDSYCQHITQPQVPFIGDLASGLEVGKQIEVIGRVKILPHSFYINLQQGKQLYPHPAVALHFNPRFKEGHIVVRNAWVKNGWGAEERFGTFCPFRPSRKFVLQIVCERTYYNFIVDGKHFVKFKYRIDPDVVDTIYIQGDVQVKDIYIR